MAFRENLKSQLQYSNMLVKELAALSGVKKKTIDSYLGTRGYKPSVDSAVSIAKALGVSVEYLVKGEVGEEDRSFTPLPSDIQEIIRTTKLLNKKDRQIVLTLARSLKNR